jgi:hypothetical protein
MTDNQYELAQHCIDTKEFLTIKIFDRYLLFHQNVVRNQLDLELPSTIIRKIFNSNLLSIKDAIITSHVNSSLYNIIIFADKSAVYIRSNENNIKKFQILPYYVNEDLELLKNIGMSKEDIDLFIKKLDANNNMELFISNKYDHIIQKIINFTDIKTRLK